MRFAAPLSQAVGRWEPVRTTYKITTKVGSHAHVMRFGPLSQATGRWEPMRTSYKITTEVGTHTHVIGRAR